MKTSRQQRFAEIRGFGLDFTHCFVLLWSVIYPKFRLTKSPTSASHETLTDNYSQNSGTEFTLTTSRQNLFVGFGIMKHKVGDFAPIFQKFRKKAELKN